MQGTRGLIFSEVQFFPGGGGGGGAPRPPWPPLPTCLVTASMAEARGVGIVGDRGGSESPV